VSVQRGAKVAKVALLPNNKVCTTFINPSLHFWVGVHRSRQVKTSESGTTYAFTITLTFILSINA